MNNGHPCWLQIPAHDVNRAVEFYKATLDFSITQLPDNPDSDEAVAMFTFPGGPLEKTFGGGIIKIPKCIQGDIQKAQSNGTRLMAGMYFYADDMEGTLAKVEAAGGKITLPRLKIGGDPTGGYCAEFRDTEGNFHGIYTSNPPK